jgi:hypothetical protein
VAVMMIAQTPARKPTDQRVTMVPPKAVRGKS